MRIKFLGAMILSSQFITSAYGVNYKYLDFEADTYDHRIWSGVPSDEKMIKESLSFLNDKEKLERKYTQTESFLHFYHQANTDINNKNFAQFSEACKKIFEESADDRDKVAVYMLLERVKQKSLKVLNLQKKLEKIKSQPPKVYTEAELQAALYLFSNIDHFKF